MSIVRMLLVEIGQDMLTAQQQICAHKSQTRRTVQLKRLLLEYELTQQKNLYKCLAIATDPRNLIEQLDVESFQELRLVIKAEKSVKDTLAAIIMILLILNEHKLVEVFIQIIMPMRKWYIIFCNQDNLNKYSLNEFTSHVQVLLPGIETTFLPVRIQKFIYSSKTKTKMNQSTNIEVRGNYHDNICGIGQEEIYNLDLWRYLMDNKIDEPMFTFESIIIQQVQGVHSGRCNQDLTESIEPFNELAAYYAQMAIKDLDLNQQHHPLLNACDILSGDKNGLDIFFGDDEIGQTFQQIKTLLSATKTQHIFHSICQYLQLQYEQQQQTKDNSFENYRLRIFWLTDSDCSDVLPILDLLLNLSQQTGLLIDLHYADSDPVQLANAQLTFNTHLTNQTKNLSIIYDETIDLYDSKTLEKIPFKSFDIIFSSNQLQGNQDLTNSLIALRRLLVPNGLLLLLELVHVPLYFDLIFCFFDQWWSSANDNNRALKNIQQWTTLLEQIEGFHIIESTTNQNESTLIISQKTISKEILQTLDERKNQSWLIFTKDDQNNKNSFSHILSTLLPCSNIRIFDIRNSTLDMICSVIPVLLTTYKQVSIIFAWQLDQVLLNENNDDDLALKQNEELIYHAQFNNDSNLNIIPSPFIGLERTLLTEYERNRLKFIDLQTSLNNNN
ncbi:unnamed protein product [Adineta steineri]|uniref:Uncharacterized protein n=1 Tax=Adineta steineri TaxID=433720 RepID=A0A819TJ22_9BILA|nr:unnamed protein product [Adineta steineri]CAF3482046.1 unnamed protein product [Adineta steineri]CAF4078763.1 unnamed protein product [Adineta steineri]